MKSTALCDVKNPLFGRNGAAYVYRESRERQGEIQLLDMGLRHFNDQVQNSTKSRNY
jgi:glycerate kinase